MSTYRVTRYTTVFRHLYLLVSILGFSAQAKDLQEDLRRLILADSAQPRSLKWTADSRQIAFLCFKASAKARLPEIVALSTESGKTATLVSSEKLIEFFRSIAPLGQQPPENLATLDFEWDPTNAGLLIKTDLSLSWFDLKKRELSLLVSGLDRHNAAQFSPDGMYVSFIRAHSLWVIRVNDKRLRRLSSAGSENVTEGELDWAYQHGFGMKAAYWWAPDSSALAYLELDETDVNQYEFPVTDTHGAKPERVRYPLPGKAIPRAHLMVAKITGGPPHGIDVSSDNFPYIPVVRWTNNSTHVAFERLSRSQTTLEMVIWDLASDAQKIVLSETDQYWINISQDLSFLSDGRFIWSSERSGFRHLYLYSSSGKLLNAITAGTWEATSIVAIDPNTRAVYFIGTEASALERQLYEIGLDGAGLKRITEKSGTHEASFAPNASMFVDQFSTATTPTTYVLYRRPDLHAITTFYENHIWGGVRFQPGLVKFYQVKTHTEVPLDALEIRPHDFDATKKYPVLVQLFSGPGTQAVHDRWDGPISIWHQFMASKGILIVALNPHGASGYGHLFEEPIHYRLGAQEMGDQRDFVSYLSSLNYVDSSRICVWGWGYGGFLALHAMLDPPVNYKAGFAVAPVAEWQNYDALFAEKYLGSPERNQNGYQASSPIAELRSFKGQLLIAQGLHDAEVHPTQTYAALQALLRVGGYANIALFPEAGHDLADPREQYSLFQQATNFLLKQY